MLQHITYNEYLPLILGNSMMEKFQLRLNTSAHVTNYDQELNPTLMNEFAAAAYRFGHTMVQGNVQLFDDTGLNVQNTSLKEHFLRPHKLWEKGFLDNYLRGLTIQPPQTVDSSFSKQLTQHLFQGGNPFGFDLFSFNIQRGRDHGLPPYNAYRKICGLQPFKTFNNMTKFMSPNIVKVFEKIYKSVEDIDLYPAGVSEFHLPGSSVGPTFACIIAEQFRRLKRGDRFWYENGNQKFSFSEAQLKEIKKASLSRVLCDNSDRMKSVQLLSFIKPSNTNPNEPCSSNRIPTVNLQPWKNEPL
jgi:peroxidase